MKNILMIGIALVITVLGLVLMAPANAEADIERYVRVGGTGDGTSWAAASGTLQAMIDAVELVGGGTVNVYKGTYYPTQEVGGAGGRYRTFQMKNGVTISGGWYFWGPSSDYRQSSNRDSQVTRLSGDKSGTPGNISDDCLHVFYHQDGTNLDSSAVLDMVTIECGNASSSGDHASGGGMFNDGSSPTLIDCTFENNHATGLGGGMANSNSSAPELIDCRFLSNTGPIKGGGMWNSGSDPELTNCTFTANTAGINGGGMSNLGSSAILTGCDFTGCNAESGGGMFNQASDPTVTDCEFILNSGTNGGGMFNNDAEPNVAGCEFINNTADVNGGGMYNESNSAPTVTNCDFYDNSGYKGGGMWNNNSSPEVTSCTFKINTATLGGGMYNYGNSNASVINSTFHGNITSNAGGGMRNHNSNPDLINCIFYDNTGSIGGGIGNSSNSNPNIYNCIIWGNNPDQFADEGSISTVNHCDIDDSAKYPTDAEGDLSRNFCLPPEFIDADNGDFHLQATSRCIDRGMNSAVSGVIHDFEGDDRIMGGDVDMGVDEYPYYTLDVGSTIGGQANTPGEGSFPYRGGTEVSIVAGPADACYSWVNWTGGGADIGDANLQATTITMNSDHSITANYTIDTFDLDYVAGANGSLTGDPDQTVDCFTDGTEITAVPDACYHFVDWSDSSTDNPRTDTNVQADVSITANFAIDTFDLTYAAGVGGSLGGVTSQTVDCYQSGSQITVIPDTCYHFVDWSDSSTDNPRTDTNVQADISVTANFAIDTFDLDYMAGAGGSLTGDPDQTVDCFTDGTEVTAVPYPGHHFVDWSDSSTDNPRTDMNVQANVNVTANFEEDAVQYTLTIAKAGNGTVTPDVGPHDYNEGAVIGITAISDTGWDFVNWTGDTTDIADVNSPTTTITMDGDYLITAIFIEIPAVWDPWIYDTNHDLSISKQEALNAVVDFFDGYITKQQALDVIVLFFS